MKLPIKGGTKSVQDARKARMQAKLDDLHKRVTGDFFKIPSGRTVVRILPPLEQNGDWYLEAAFHYRMGEESRTILCPKRYANKDCPICELADEYKNSDDAMEKKIARHIIAKRRIFANVFIPDEGVKVLAFGPTVFEQILGIFLDPEYGDLDDVEEGRNIAIVRSGKKMETKYQVTPLPKVRPLSEYTDDVDVLLEQRRNLKGLVALLDYDEIKDLLDATDLEALTKPQTRGEEE